MSKPSLTQLEIGQTCHVNTIELTGLLKRRVLDLGLVPGTLVKCVRRSPSGNPVAYHVRGTTIALRNEDADFIKVKL
ncbi:FeoA family protein [Anaerosinus massiliensis]|uniref:FeoA family protein n=1 Tax=Massilibacillus massiliensis TaxID=1806837 RepID=UPI0018FE89A8|nr:FeoA family protein [Massilibacillus massiliensis]